MSEVVKLARSAGSTCPDIPYFLTEAETRRHGVDIGGAMQKGMLTPDDFREILAYCRVCTDGPVVRQEPGHDRCADSAPDWCANRAILEGLRGLV